MDQGWIKLHRKLLSNPVWLSCNASQKIVLITILLKANHIEKKWLWKGEEFEAKPGQLITSLESLSKDSGVKKQSVRSSLVKFEKYKILTNESTKTGRLISVINWEAYQGFENQPNIAANKDPTKTQHRANIEPTPNKNDKNYKNDNNDKKKETDLSGLTKNIIDYLNSRTGKHFKNVPKTRDLIKARLNDGFQENDFYVVISKKTTEWIDDHRMNKFLRPETLFGSKFEGYLNQLEVKKPLTLHERNLQTANEFMNETENHKTNDLDFLAIGS